MDLEATIMDVLRSTSSALTFEDVVQGVMHRLKPQIRQALNELSEDHIQRHVGGRDQPWRYQALPPKRRI